MAPGPVTVKASLLKGLEPRKAALYTSIAKAANKGNYGYLTWTFWPPKSNKYIIEEIEKVWAKTITPAQYLDGLDKVYQEELKAKATPPVPKR
jgi:raffinose/stachyose/melibiose transport system substrate-binding protein